MWPPDQRPPDGMVFNDHPVNEDLVFFWPGTYQGQKAIDLVRGLNSAYAGTAIPITYNNSHGDGRFGPIAVFAGGQQRAKFTRITADGIVDLSKPWTFSLCQFRSTATTATSYCTWGFYNAAKTQYLFTTHRTDGFFKVNTNGETAPNGVTTLPLQQWYHSLVSYDGTTFSIYINGSLDYATNPIGNNWQSCTQLFLPFNRNTNKTWNGALASFRIHQRCLGPGEARDLAKLPWLGLEPAGM